MAVTDGIAVHDSPAPAGATPKLLYHYHWPENRRSISRYRRNDCLKKNYDGRPDVEERWLTFRSRLAAAFSYERASASSARCSFAVVDLRYPFYSTPMQASPWIAARRSLAHWLLFNWPSCIGILYR